MKLRWGIIGAGDIVRKRVAPAFLELENCELLALVRRDSGRAEAAAQQFGVPRWYTDVQGLFSDPEIDAVYVASPVFLHAEHTIRAAEAGKHVLCEKPMALNTDECDRMIAAAEANGVRLGIAYYRRFYPVLERVREALRNGEIGEPVFVQANAFERFDPGPDHPRRWFIEKAKSGGGPMMDFGCHRIELLLDLFGDAAEVKGIDTKVVYEREVEDTCSAILRFASGPVAALTVTHAVEASVDSIEIFGTRGTIKIGSLNSGEIAITTGGSNRTEVHAPAENFHLPLIADFTDAVLNGREPRVTAADGRKVNDVLAHIYGQ